MESEEKNNLDYKIYSIMALLNLITRSDNNLETEEDVAETIRVLGFAQNEINNILEHLKTVGS